MRKKYLIILIPVIAVLTFITGLVIWQGVASNSNKREIIATVTEKEIKNYNDKGKYLIFTKDDDVEVYEITDSLFQGRWDSSDLYGKIEEGKTYKFTVVGIRNNFFSMYPNILEAEEVK